jgi:hypothetical protein
MKKLMAVSMVVIAASLAFLGSQVSRARGPRTLTIKVTSADPNRQIAFDASYIFQSDDCQLQHVERVTPFEVKATSEFVAAIFRDKSNSGEMVVQLISSTEGETETKGNAGRADVVVLSTSGSGEFPYSVQGFSTK